MGKRKKNKHILMRDWPNNDTVTLPYSDLITPLKRILIEGYDLQRLPIMQFAYNGYNIAKEDQIYSPTPSERFSSRWLENEKKFQRTLLDNVLATAFQLGVEQGRRYERSGRYNNKLLLDIIQAKTNEVKNLSCRLGNYEPQFAGDEAVPLESDNQNLLIDIDNPFAEVDAQNAKEG